MSVQKYVMDIPRGCAIAQPGPLFGKVVENVQFERYDNGYEVVPTRVVIFEDGSTQRFANDAKIEINMDTEQRRERVAYAQRILNGEI